jgi:hypothetical protein
VIRTACTRIATALLLLTFCVNTSLAQLNFDIGDAEIAVRNSSGSISSSLAVTVKNLIFDEDLALTHTYAFFENAGSIPSGQSWGFDGPWSFDAASGDVNSRKDTLGCSEYEFSIASQTFRINLTDAKWGAGSNSMVYKFLFDWDGSSWSIYVRSPGPSGTWSSAVSVTNGDSFTYWGLIRDTHLASYKRERTTYNRKTFHVDGSDNLLPLPSTLVTSARLDVNLAVHTDIAVPDGSSLLIEGFDEGLAANSGTTLSFDGSTGMTVYGSLRTIETEYQNEYISFVSSAGTPAPGDWTGVHCDDADLLWLNRIFIQHAGTGLFIEDCEDVEGYDVNVLSSYGDGVKIDSSTGIFQDLKSNSNNGNGALITGSQVDVHYGVFNYSAWQNGVVAGQGSTVRLQRCRMFLNRMNGALVSGASRVIVDSSDISYSGHVAGEDWYGIYGFYNDEWLTVRYSNIFHQSIGLAMVYAKVNGYESSDDPPNWDNADSLARNCIFENDYNLLGYYSTFELARTYYNGAEPHYQGGESSIYDPNTLQGSFEYSTAWLHRDFWNGNTIFNVSNSTVTTDDALLADSAGCQVEDRSASPSTGAVWNPRLLALFQTWEALDADSLRALLYQQRNTLSAQDAAAGFDLVWRRSLPSVAETYFKLLIGNCTRTEILLPAWRYVASARMDASDWSGAAQALLAMTQQAATGSSSYTSAHAMSALTKHWAGATPAARASLDTLLSAYPGDNDLVMVDRLIGGSSPQITPKRSSIDTPENGYELHAVSPNPFTASTVVTFTLPEACNVLVAVHDMAGREVQRIADGWHARGTSQTVFQRGTLPSGVYMLRMTAANATRTRMMHIIR